MASTCFYITKNPYDLTPPFSYTQYITNVNNLASISYLTITFTIK